MGKRYLCFCHKVFRISAYLPLLRILGISGNPSNLPHSYKNNIYGESSQWIQCICQRSEGNMGLIECATCKTRQHIKCVGVHPPFPNYECTSCLLSGLDPLAPVHKHLIIAQQVRDLETLTQFHQNRKSYTNSFILRDEDFMLLKSQGTNYRIQIRCIKLAGKDTKQEHAWPVKGYLVANDEFIQEFRVPESNIATKRKDKPAYISNLKQGSNTFEFVHEMLKGESFYAFQISIVENYSVLRLFDHIKETQTRNLEDCRQFVMSVAHERYAKMEDDECQLIEAKQVKINFKCPFTFRPISEPGRGNKCRHLEVFHFIYAIYTLYP